MDGYDIKREGVPGSRMMYHIFNLEGTEEEIRGHLTKTIDDLFAAANRKKALDEIFPTGTLKGK